MTGWLDGKRALIVGGGSGIGRAVVDAFRAEGARIAVLERDRDKCDRLREQLPGVPVIEGDAVTREANERAVKVAVDAYGGLDTLVNCVGVFDFYKGVGDIDADDLSPAFDEMFRTNVLSHLQSVKAAVAVAAGRYRVRDRADRVRVVVPSRTWWRAVCSSKFAVRGLVAALAHELAPAIRVNGVAPGGTLNTDLRGPATLGLNSVRLDDTPNRAHDLAVRTPLNVALSGEDHAWSFVFLASDRSRGLTGETVHPDGGFRLGAPKST